ncbi:MAG: type II toxin-antitoxin system VapC family toxin [Sulfuricellaceae bacterium]|jgi:tRNA(fMet)-specific endonuclease VapC
MRYMLDTNICIHLIRRQSPAVAERFRRLSHGDAVISVVTFAELRHGVERDPLAKEAAERALSLLQSFIPVVPFDNDAAVSYGVVAAAVKDRRRDALDRLIAAHALSLSLTLVTNNEADFRDYPGLEIENWVN